MIHIAIDPGTSGGVAWGSNPHDAQAENMPETRQDLIDLLREIVFGNPKNCVAYIEKVAPFIPDGGASQMFAFGAQAERPACILQTLNVRIIEVTPKEWQKALGLGNSERQKVPQAPRMPSPPRGSSPGQKRQWKRDNAAAHKTAVDSFKKEHAEAIKSVKSANARAKTEWKNKLRSAAQQRFPKLAMNLSKADALLLLDYSFQKTHEN